MNNSTNLILNRDAPPFDNPEIRGPWRSRIDRKAFIDILNQGEAELGGTMQPRARRRVGPAEGDLRPPCRATDRTSRRTASEAARS